MAINCPRHVKVLFFEVALCLQFHLSYGIILHSSMYQTTISQPITHGSSTESKRWHNYGPKTSYVQRSTTIKSSAMSTMIVYATPYYESDYDGPFFVEDYTSLQPVALRHVNTPHVIVSSPVQRATNGPIAQTIYFSKLFNKENFSDNLTDLNSESISTKIQNMSSSNETLSSNQQKFVNLDVHLKIKNGSTASQNILPSYLNFQRVTHHITEPVLNTMDTNESTLSNAVQPKSEILKSKNNNFSSAAQSVNTESLKQSVLHSISKIPKYSKITENQKSEASIVNPNRILLVLSSSKIISKPFSVSSLNTESFSNNFDDKSDKQIKNKNLHPISAFPPVSRFPPISSFVTSTQVFQKSHSVSTIIGSQTKKAQIMQTVATPVLDNKDSESSKRQLFPVTATKFQEVITKSHFQGHSNFLLNASQMSTASQKHNAQSFVTPLANLKTTPNNTKINKPTNFDYATITDSTFHNKGKNIFSRSIKDEQLNSKKQNIANIEGYFLLKLLDGLKRLNHIELPASADISKITDDHTVEVVPGKNISSQWIESIKQNFSFLLNPDKGVMELLNQFKLIASEIFSTFKVIVELMPANERKAAYDQAENMLTEVSKLLKMLEYNLPPRISLSNLIREAESGSLNWRQILETLNPLFQYLNITFQNLPISAFGPNLKNRSLKIVSNKRAIKDYFSILTPSYKTFEQSNVPAKPLAKRDINAIGYQNSLFSVMMAVVGMKNSNDTSNLKIIQETLNEYFSMIDKTLKHQLSNSAEKENNLKSQSLINTMIQQLSNINNVAALVGEYLPRGVLPQIPGMPFFTRVWDLRFGVTYLKDSVTSALKWLDYHNFSYEQIISTVLLKPNLENHEQMKELRAKCMSMLKDQWKFNKRDKGMTERALRNVETLGKTLECPNLGLMDPVPQHLLFLKSLLRSIKKAGHPSNPTKMAEAEMKRLLDIARENNRRMETVYIEPEQDSYSFYL